MRPKAEWAIDSEPMRARGIIIVDDDDDDDDDDDKHYFSVRSSSWPCKAY